MNRYYRMSGWTDDAIRKSYIEARHKPNQIGVLCQLTLLNRDEIYEILGDLMMEKPKKAIKTPRERNVIDWQPIQELYNQGLTDSEICMITGVGVGTIWAWRKREKLSPNKRTKIIEAI